MKFLSRILDRIFRLPQLPVYRRVIDRVPAQDGASGEIITLECSHRFRVVFHQREIMPCEECGELAKKQQAKAG